MFLPKSDVFKDLRQEAINDISEIAVEESYDAGTVLFSASDPATAFYILVAGRVGLSIGDAATTHYTVSRIGESFGWSSVVGRPVYSARAECLEPTKLMKIDSRELERVFESHEASGHQFFRRLAGALGERWVELHRSMMSESKPGIDASYGTGQIVGGKSED